MAEIMQETPFDELYNEVDVAAKNRDIFLENLSSEMSKMISVMDKVQKGTRVEILHSVLKILDGDLSSKNVGEMENKCRKLEDRERKLVVELNNVMANLYLLPGYVLAVSTGISGLLSSDPHSCGLLVCVLLVVLSFLASLVVAVLFANRQLDPLILKHKELADERVALHNHFKHIADVSIADASLAIAVKSDAAAAGGTDAAAAGGTDAAAAGGTDAAAAATAGGTDAAALGTAGTVTAAENLTSYEKVNKELEFQAYYYKKFLLLIIFVGILYAFMLLVTADCVLCDCKAFSVNTIVGLWQWLLIPYL